MHSSTRLSQLTTLRPWRFAWDWSLTTAPALGSILLCEQIDFRFYPVAVLLNGHAFLRLLNLGHEGIHGLLAPNRKLNDFLSRYLCLFPLFASHSRFKTLHSLHHRLLNNHLDPDCFQFVDFPVEIKRWWPRYISERLRFRYTRDYINYFTEIPERTLLHQQQGPRLLSIQSDFAEFCVFWAILLCTIFWLQVPVQFALYWVIPAILTLPWIRMITALQHGAFPEGHTLSRSVSGHGPLFGFLFPLHVNYHGEHHLNPKVPHYNLPQFAKLIETTNLQPKPVRVTLRENFRALFNAPSSASARDE